MRKREIFNLVHILCPMVLGGMIYFLLRPDTYIAHWGYQLFGWRGLEQNTNRIVSQFCRNYACDMLWAYALAGALMAALDGNGRYVMAGCLAWGTGILLELLQKWEILSGTFDLWDMLLEGIAVAGAILIHILYERGEKHEKENSKGNRSNISTLRLFFGSGRKWKR